VGRRHGDLAAHSARRARRDLRQRQRSQPAHETRLVGKIALTDMPADHCFICRRDLIGEGPLVGRDDDVGGLDRPLVGGVGAGDVEHGGFERDLQALASLARTGLAVTISSARVMCWPMVAIRSITPLPTCGPSPGSVIAVPSVTARGSHDVASIMAHHQPGTGSGCTSQGLQERRPAARRRRVSSARAVRLIARCLSCRAPPSRRRTATYGAVRCTRSGSYG
jgi:hypothetical protein